MLIAWFGSWGCGWCGCHQAFFWPQPCDHCDWYGDQHGADATCNNHQPSAAQNHNPCWYSWSDSDQRFHHARDHEQLTPGTLVASHPASSWIKMVLPPSWDHHFKMWRVARMFTHRWTWNHPLLCLSPRYPSCIQSQRFRLRSGELQGSPYWLGPLHAGPSLAIGCWPWRYFLDRPCHIYYICSGHGGRIDAPLNIIICICTVFEVSHVLTWVYSFPKFHLVSVWNLRCAMGANVERNLCAVLCLCVFFARREITCHWQRVEPTIDFPAAQFIAQLWFAYCHSVFLSDLANENHQLVFCIGNRVYLRL